MCGLPLENEMVETKRLRLTRRTQTHSDKTACGKNRPAQVPRRPPCRRPDTTRFAPAKMPPHQSAQHPLAGETARSDSRGELPRPAIGPPAKSSVWQMTAH